jgi:nitrate/nitrite transporter NarK
MAMGIYHSWDNWCGLGHCLVCPSWKKSLHAVSQRETKQDRKPHSGPSDQFTKNRTVQAFILIRFLLDPVFYFLMFWVPKYLNQERDLSFERIGELFWIPFLALGLSNILGGWCSDKLIARNLSINAARKWVMGFAAAVTLVAPFISTVSSVEVAILLDVFDDAGPRLLDHQLYHSNWGCIRKLCHFYCRWAIGNGRGGFRE